MLDQRNPWASSVGDTLESAYWEASSESALDGPSMFRGEVSKLGRSKSERLLPRCPISFYANKPEQLSPYLIWPFTNQCGQFFLCRLEISAGPRVWTPAARGRGEGWNIDASKMNISAESFYTDDAQRDRLMVAEQMGYTEINRAKCEHVKMRIRRREIWIIRALVDVGGLPNLPVKHCLSL